MQAPQNNTPEQVCDKLEKLLDSKKATDIVRISLQGKSSIADYMLVASGISNKHIQMLAELLKQELHNIGIKPIYIEGGTSDWVLLDAGDVIVHLFRPDVREFYNLEKMWGVDLADFQRKVAETS